MSGWYTKEEKLKLLKQVEGLESNTTQKVLNIRRETIWRWHKELNLLGEEGLIIKFSWNDKTRINWIYWDNEWYKKVLSKINKEEILYDFAIEEKISD